MGRGGVTMSDLDNDPSTPQLTGWRKFVDELMYAASIEGCNCAFIVLVTIVVFVVVIILKAMGLMEG